MKTAAVLSLAAAVMAAPAPQTYSAPSGPFGGVSSRSGSDVHLLPFAASDRQIWLKKPTSTYCPEAQVSCEGRTKDTVFGANGGALSMDVGVPGGQQAYITPEGQFKYTGAHSAAMEQGSVSTGFEQTEGRLTFEGNDWYACPVGDGSYKVYAASKASGEGCEGVSFVTAGFSGEVTPAWQYT